MPEGVDAPPGNPLEDGTIAFSSRSAVADRRSPWTPINIYLLAMLGIANAFSAIDRFMFGLFAPLIKADLKLTDTEIGMLGGIAFAVTYAGAAIPLAMLADRWARRTVLALGFATWSLMGGLCGAAHTFGQMVLARAGLGAAESTASTCSSSMIADLFPIEHRPLALSIFSSLSPLGFLITFPLLGSIAQDHGWRMAFFVAGGTGLALSIIFYLTVKEPKRDLVPGTTSSDPIPVREAFHKLARLPVYLLGVLSLILYTMNASAFQAWLPSLLERSYGLDTREAASWIGLLRGSAGIIGSFAAGMATLWLARFNSAWLFRVPALALAMIVPAQLLLLFGGIADLWKISLAIETLFSIGLIGPLFAVIISMVPSRMRALSFAISTVSAQIVGQSLGPFAVGVISDVITPTFGPDSLRVALLAAVAVAGLASMSCFMAGRHFHPDAS